MAIEWRKIPGYENYIISTQGDVVRIMTQKGKPVRRNKHPSDNGLGYRVVVLSKDGKRAMFRVHRLVMLTFCGASEQEVNHKDGNKANNCLDNLEYISRGDNVRHASQQLGAQYGARGEKHHNAKLTKDDIDTIFCMKAQGRSLREIGDELDVHFTTVRDVVNRKTWK